MHDVWPTDAVLFLDVDGVLNSKAFLTRPSAGLVVSHDAIDWADMIDPENVAHLNRILSETGAKVVVSSSWRSMFKELGDLEAVLQSRGFRGRLEDRTPARMRATARGFEIDQWRHQNGHTGPIVILDDNSDMEHMLPWLVQTSFDTGLTAADADRAIETLRATPPSHMSASHPVAQ
jgi:hypothetical protein